MVISLTNQQAVAAGSLVNLATILYLNSIRVSHPLFFFFLSKYCAPFGLKISSNQCFN